jgi:hypothetical protein
MTNTKTKGAALLLGFMVLSFLPPTSSAQVTESEVFRAESAILSAGARAAAISHLRNVPSIGVINLAIRYKPRFRSNLPDVSEFRISAEKNFASIHRLQRALAANPITHAALADHGVSPGHVVGVDISSNGSLRLYILD